MNVDVVLLYVLLLLCGCTGTNVISKGNLRAIRLCTAPASYLGATNALAPAAQAIAMTADFIVEEIGVEEKRS